MGFRAGEAVVPLAVDHTPARPLGRSGGNKSSESTPQHSRMLSGELGHVRSGRDALRRSGEEPKM